MAREWNLAPSGGLMSLIQAYQSGSDRARKQATDVSDRQQKADEWTAEHAPYKQNTVDNYGNPNGLESNDDSRKQDLDYFDLRKDQGSPGPAVQGMNARTPAPAASPPPAPEPALTPSGRPIGATQSDLAGGNPAPSSPSFAGQPPAPPQHPSAGPGKAELAPGDPAPLVRDPEVARTEAKATADKLAPRPGMDSPGEQSFTAQPPVKGPNGEKVVMPQGAESMQYSPNDKPITKDGQSFIPARQVNQNFDKDLDVSGTQNGGAPAANAAPPAPAAKPGLEPSDYAMKKLVDMNTMLPRNGVGFVDASGLSPEVQAMLGAVNGKVRSDVLRTYLGEQGRLGAAEIGAGGKRVDPIAADLIDAIQKDRLPLGSAISMYTRRNGGVGPSGGTMAAMKSAAGLGNQDRNFGMATDKFNQGKDDKAAAIAQTYTKPALAETKSDLEAINTLNTVDSMLQRKDTNGLRKLVPLIIERGFVPQRLTNQMISADTGLQGLDQRFDQWLTGLEDGSITPANVGFFRSLVQEGKQEHLNLYAQKVQRYKRAGVGALMQHGMTSDKAQQFMDQQLDPNMQGAGGGGDGSGGTSGAPPAQAAPEQTRKNFVPTKEELDLRKEMMMTTQALRQAKTPQQQATIKKMFQDRNHIPWDNQ